MLFTMERQACDPVDSEITRYKNLKEYNESVTRFRRDSSTFAI